MSIMSKTLAAAFLVGGVASAFAQNSPGVLQVPAPNLGRPQTNAQAVQQNLIRQHLLNGAQIQQEPEGVLVTPASSIPHPVGSGLNRTHYKIFFPVKAFDPSNSLNAAGGPPFSGYNYETPASLACVYALQPVKKACNPNLLGSAANSKGGTKAVGIVDAYHAPNARTDLNFYSTQFGLPQTNTNTFIIWYCGTTVASCQQTTPPPYDSGWEGEISLDVQMVHAIAPHAKIILVEAHSNSGADLGVAAQKAADLVAAAGGGQVSMSFGHNEYNGDPVGDNPIYTHNKVSFFASTGDAPGVEYPSAATNVIAVGGTSVSRNPKNGNLIGESAWYDAGGGVSAYQPRPAYQDSFSTLLGTHRGVPDVAAVANPRTGVWIYIANQSGWNIFGGTSAASPVMAAIVNVAGHFKTTSTNELTFIYANRTTTGAYFDVKQGICGPYTGYWAKLGYDLCTGVGSPRGLDGK